MKKIINGFRYDTQKAVEVGNYHSGHTPSDFQGWTATLYKTPRSGRFFLHGHGGPMTRFADHHGNSVTDGERIVLMSKEEALEWAEQYLGVEDIERHFLDSIEEA